MLETISRSAFHYFEVERNPGTGLIKDRAHNFETGGTRSPASIAATGFALTAYAVAVKRNWMDAASARELTQLTLEFFLTGVPHEHGFFYHFLNPETGARTHGSELSPIDTALFLAGVLFAAEFYEDIRIRELARELYERVDWPWMLHGGKTFAMSWSPENGFQKGRWDHYNESMILYLLAIGSPTRPIPAASWKAISRPVGSYKGRRLIQMPPLFTHQYSHIWIDFRNKNDGAADYFKNSINASLANRAFCQDQSSRFKTYGPNAWGLTASDGPFGYRAYGSPPGWADHDGTLAPTGCGSSIVFTPQESIDCLRHFYENFHDKIWGQYGFSDAFNADKNWYSKDAIGIDQGALLLMIENYRSGMIWEVMGRNTNLKEAMEKVGFVPGTKELPWPDPPAYLAPYVFGGMEIDGYLRDWSDPSAISLDLTNKEGGDIKDEKDLSAKIRFAWDEDALYFSAQVTDDFFLGKRTGKNIWQDDALEIYIDPQADGLYWYDKSDYQIGFRADKEDGIVQSWSWFQGGEDLTASAAVQAKGFVDAASYVLEGRIRWNYIGVIPKEEMTLRLSAAVHDADRDRSNGKLQWFLRNEEEHKRFALGKVILKKSK